MKTGEHLVYVLVDPRTCEWRYVGKTSQAMRPRMRQHKCGALAKTQAGVWKDLSHRACWLRKLYQAGLRPEVLILETFSTLEEVNQAERDWIACARRNFVRLTNETDGGDGAIVSRKPSVSDEEVVSDYLEGVPSTRIAKNHKTCKKRVLEVLRRAGIVRQPNKLNRDELCGQYAAGRSTVWLARKYGVSPNSILYHLKQQQVEVRSHLARGR